MCEDIKTNINNIKSDINDIKNNIKKCKNICKCKSWLCGVCIVLILCIIGLIVFSTCCASKVQTTTEIVNNTVNTTIKFTNVLCNNPYFFLFLIACLGLIGVIIFFFCTCCREKTKQDLLTEAYDKALEKLEDDRDKHMVDTPKEDIDAKTKKAKHQEINESTQAQNPKPAEETITTNRYYKKTVTKIFETYCKNITAK